MRRASSPTLARHPSARPALLPRRLYRWLRQLLRTLEPALRRGVRTTNADAGRRRCTSRAHACFLLAHALSDRSSLRQTYAALPAYRELAAWGGLQAADSEEDHLTVSFSQLADANTSRPAAFLVPVIAALAQRLATRPDRPFPAALHALDSTFLYVSSTRASWLTARKRQHASGAKLLIDYQPATDCAAVLTLSDSKVPDVRGLEAGVLDDPVRLAGYRDALLAVDLGFYSHERFVRLRAAGVHFVTRLHQQALVTVEAARPVQQHLPAADPTSAPGQITVLRDERVGVGSANNRAGAALAGLRLVTAMVAPEQAAARRGKVSQEYQILTDRFDLDAALVVQLYRWRWQIELFFAWLKGHLQLRLLGYSRNALVLSVYVALLAHLLCLLTAESFAQPRRTPVVRTALISAVHTLPAGTLTAPQPLQLALPGLEWDPCT